MNAVTIEPPATPDSRAGAGLWELGGGALLAFAAHAAEVPPGSDPRPPRLIADLRRFLAAEHERLAGFLPSLTLEEIPLLLADLLTRAQLPADTACVLTLYKEGTVHLLASGGAAAYLAAAATGGTGAPVRRVIDGAVSFLLPGAPSGEVAPGLPRLSGPPGASRRFLPSEVVRLPAAGSLVVLLSGEVEPPLRERLLAALQSSRDPADLESLLRGAVERAGLALLAYSAADIGDRAGELPRREIPEGMEAELAALRREVERRLVRLDGRLHDVEELATGFAATAGRPRFTFPGLPSLARPKPPLPRRPGAEEAGSADDGPKFERGLDVPVASNWSRPLLLVTGGITLLLFLLVQLFCPAPPPRRRVVPAPKVVPAATAPAAGQKPPVGVLLVTPTSEPEGTEGAATEPQPLPPPGRGTGTPLR
jgi:hypothetical protein